MKGFIKIHTATENIFSSPSFEKAFTEIENTISEKIASLTPERDFEDFDFFRDTEEINTAQEQAREQGYYGTRATGLVTPTKKAILLSIEECENYDIAHFEIV